jgi:CheY-like chemotaxis protein
VLVVDDSADNREIYAAFLRYAGLAVVTAASAEEGLAKAAAEPPAVVVMDLALPRMDGFEATRRLKAHPRTKGAKIIVVTGHAIDEYQDRARDAGADAVCTKPCLPDDLLAQVKRMIALANAARTAKAPARARRR